MTPLLGKTLVMVLQTRSSRAFLVLLGLVVTGSIGAWYWIGPTHLKPTDVYYWTEAFSKAGIDIRSPNRKAIIDSDIYPPSGPLSRELQRRLKERCDLSVRNNSPNAGGAVTVGAEWRGVSLCNSADLGKEEFEVAHSYFKTRVDEDYNRFYSGTTGDLLGFIVVGLISWCLLLLGWRIYRWVISAPESPVI
jgi:hypothetical protein